MRQWASLYLLSNLFIRCAFPCGIHYSMSQHGRRVRPTSCVCVGYISSRLLPVTLGRPRAAGYSEKRRRVEPTEARGSTGASGPAVARATLLRPRRRLDRGSGAGRGVIDDRQLTPADVDASFDAAVPSAVETLIQCCRHTIRSR